MKSQLFTLCLIHILPFISADGLVYATKNANRARRTNDIYKKTPDFVEALGYKVETHLVTTTDGYILTLHRIPGAKIGEDVSNHIGGKRVIFVQHGYSGASDSWLLLGRKSFPIQLVENGFDVWLGNSRGTSYSNKHVNLTASDREYWDFTFHENGIYDLPVSIDYALSVSGVETLYYAGHSRGGTQGLVLLASKPEYNKKIRLFIAVAPVAYLRNTRSLLMRTMFNEIVPSYTEKVLNSADFFYLPIRNRRGRQLYASTCGGISFNPCWLAVAQLFGSRTTLNQTRLPVFFSHFPDGDSVKSALHFIQIGRTDRFAQYDHGKGNMKKYGSILPPTYNLRDVSTRVMLVHAPADDMADKFDMERLARELPNMVGLYSVNDTNFNHIDVVWGAESDELFSKPIIKKIFDYGY